MTEVHDAGDDVDLPGMHPGVGLKVGYWPLIIPDKLFVLFLLSHGVGKE